MRILLIAVAGAFGALSRYGLSSYVSNAFGDKFAYGTLAVNTIGCFLIGLIMHIALTTDMISEDIRTAVTIGFLGALTTFSTFSYETYKFIEDAAWRLAVLNISANVILGLAATIVGLAVGRLLAGGA